MPKGDFWKKLTPSQKTEILKKRKETKLKKYGNANYNNIEKCKQTKLQRYGNLNYNNTEKAKQTCLKKYGVEHSQQTETIKNKLRDYWKTLDPEELSKKKKEEWDNKTKEEIKEIVRKREQTKLEKYGNPNYKNIDKLKQSRFQTSFEKLLNSDRLKKLVEPLFNISAYQGSFYNTDYKWKCCKCGNEFLDNLEDGKVPSCPVCFPKLGRSSSYEKELQEWLNNLIKINTNKWFFDKEGNRKYELDIFIPSKNIGIEFNGLHWHSEIAGNKDRNYHIDKSNFFEKEEIQILHIFEDEWIEKQEIVKSIIRSKLGLITHRIFARKCEIKEVSSKDACLFLFDNHIQGEINSKVRLGLYYNNELVSLMTFGKPRYNKDYDWEMLRFCNKIGISVVGAGGKLLSYFRKIKTGSIISYADKRYSMGGFYKGLGFVKLRESPPDYFYFKQQTRYSRVQFQKHKLKEKLEIFDPNLTEWQNMQLNRYDRIWDCGNLVYVLK